MLEEIEEKFSFKYPDLYKNLYRDGMLNWGKQGPNWYEEFYPILRKNPPLLLFAGDFELLNQEDIEKSIEKLSKRTTKNHKAIPFGKNGAGEFYAFLYTSPKTIESVCLINREDSLINLAQNFEDFIFREILGAAVQINPDDLENHSDFRTDLYAMSDSHNKYISKQRVKIIKDIYAKEIQEDDDGESGMISIEEYEKILKTEIDFPKLNKRIAF